MKWWEVWSFTIHTYFYLANMYNDKHYGALLPYIGWKHRKIHRISELMAQPHCFNFIWLEMTSKTKLFPQVENGGKIALWDFMVSNATLSETNALFCLDHGVKLLSSCLLVGQIIIQTSIRANFHRVRWRNNNWGAWPEFFYICLMYFLMDKWTVFYPVVILFSKIVPRKKPLPSPTYSHTVIIVLLEGIGRKNLWDSETTLKGLSFSTNTVFVTQTISKWERLEDDILFLEMAKKIE